ncbi:MAG: helix-turn-helix transcriptional regulator [Eubacteriales bacterium]|jgi:AraC-like DNA-binding protein
MTEHFAESITLSRLAEIVGISELHLGKIFKAVTGKPPIDYLLDIRINRAKELLRDGVSVTETSRLVGINDIYYFSRAFKKREGVPPSVYSSNKTEY